MIKYGAYYGQTDFKPIEFAKAAEDAGFDSLWGHDHSIHSYDGLALLGLFVGATESIPIGSNIMVIPYRHPSAVATCLLTLAYAADRKLILGVGTGGERADEFALAHADPRVRGRYTNEALDVIRTLWTQRPASFHGEWSDFEDVNIVYQPEVQITPDIWVGGRSDAAMRRAVRYASGYNPVFVSPRQAADRFANLRSHAAEVGRDVAGFTFAVSTMYHPGDSVEDAVKRQRDQRGSLDETEERRFRGHNMIGNDDDCLEKLQQYVDAGAEHIVIGCPPGSDGSKYFAMFERIRDAARQLTPAAPGGHRW